MAIGTVKWFNMTEGHRFIAPEGGGQDAFVHISAVEKAGYTGLAEEGPCQLRAGRGPQRQDVRG